MSWSEPVFKKQPKNSDMPRIDVGETDPMSKMAIRWRMPSCRAQTPFGETFLECTRAAGHTESKPDHPGTQHVAAGADYRALAVWW